MRKKKLTREQALEKLKEIDRLEAELKKQQSELIESNPFWFYEPSDGSISDKALALLQRFLKEEDIPQGKLDSQLDIHKCDSSIILGAGGNQCLAADEFIYTPYGVREVENMGNDIDTLGGKTSNFHAFYDDVWKVTFSNGLSIKCNGEHPFFWKKRKRIKEGGWMSLDEISENLNSDGKNNNYGYVYFTRPEEWNLSSKKIDHAELLGYLCSDGSIGDEQSIKFTNNSYQFCKHVSDLSECGFGIKGKFYKKGKGFDVLLTYKKDQLNPIRTYLKSLEVNKGSLGFIQSGCRDSLIDFLRGYFNGDGYLLIRRRKSGYGYASKHDYPEIGFCIGEYRDKAYQMQYILWKLGIGSYISEESMRGSTTPFWRLKVSAKDVCKLIDILDWSKYPDKFLEAKYLCDKVASRHCSDGWISIRSIQYVGNKCVVGWQSETHEIISYCGMKTHNTGKTTCAVIEGIIWSTGEIPDSLKGIYPESKLPKKFPVRGRIVGVNHKTLHANLIPAMKYWVPKEYLKNGRWSDSWSAENQVLTLWKDGKEVATIDLMTNQQDVEAFQGPPRDWVIYDEEPRHDIYKENLMRFTTAGRLKILFAMTPTSGMTWIKDEILDRAGNPELSISAFKMPTLINRKANLDVVRENVEQLSSYEEIKMRLLGEFVSLSGLVYGNLFQNAVHVIPPFFEDLKPEEKIDYVCLSGWDLHLVTETAGVFLLLDKHGNKYVDKCYFKQCDTDELKKDFHSIKKESGYRMGWSVADKSSNTTVIAFGGRNIFREVSQGKDCIPALRTSVKFEGSIKAGVNEIKKDLKINEETKKPRLFVVDRPENRMLIQSFKTLERDTYANEDAKGPKDRIKEGKHHLHAALRYIYQFPMNWYPENMKAPEPVLEEIFA